MKYFKIFLVFLSSMALLLSCKKDERTSQSEIQLLTQQSWILAQERWDPSNTGWLEFFIPTCRKDNIITFYSNLSLINNEGATKCYSSDPQIFATATWTLFDNNTKIAISENGITEYHEILQLDNQIFKILHRDTGSQSITLYENTFSH
jgi:hypothetical protein